VLARVILDERPLTIEGTRVPVGNYALALWPNVDGRGMQVEIRRVDMREVYPDVNALAPAPHGETILRGTVSFDRVSPTVPRLDLTFADAAGGRLDLITRWGDRRLVLTVVR
jgi:hypothetical protein